MNEVLSKKEKGLNGKRVIWDLVAIVAIVWSIVTITIFVINKENVSRCIFNRDACTVWRIDYENQLLKRIQEVSK